MFFVLNLLFISMLLVLARDLDCSDQNISVNENYYSELY